MLQDYSYTIAAGGSTVVALDADGFVITESNLAKFKIEINDRAGVIFERQFEYLSPAGAPIEKLRLINDNAVPLVVTFKAWRGAFRDRRSIFNQVQGVEPISLSDLRDQTFIGHLAATVTGSGNSRCDFFNPASSGKLCVVNRIRMSADNNLRYWIRETSGIDLTSNLDIRSKYLGGVTSPTMRINQQSNITNPFSLPILDAGYVSPNLVADIDLSQPLILAPGTGIVFVAFSSVTLRALGSVEFLEIDG